MALKGDWVDGDVMASNHATEHNEITTAIAANAAGVSANAAAIDVVEADVAAIRQVPTASAGQVGKWLKVTGAGAWAWSTPPVGAKGAKGDKGDKGDPGNDGADGGGVPDTTGKEGNIFVVDSGGTAVWFDSPAFNPSGETVGRVWTVIDDSPATAGWADASGGAAADVLIPASNVNGTYTCDLAAGTVWNLIPNGATTIAFSNVPASGTPCYAVISVYQPGTLYAFTWPAAVKWEYGTAPSMAISKTYTFVFYTTNGGTDWFAKPSYMGIS